MISEILFLCVEFTVVALSLRVSDTVVVRLNVNLHRLQSATNHGFQEVFLSYGLTEEAFPSHNKKSIFITKYRYVLLHRSLWLRFVKPHNKPSVFRIPPLLLDLKGAEVEVQESLLPGEWLTLVQTEARVLQAVVAAEEDGERVRHCGLSGDDDGLVDGVWPDLVVVYLDHPPGLGSQDELAAAPGVAGYELSRAAGVLQRDGLHGAPAVDRHLHGEVVEVGVPVSHPEPGQQPRDDVPAGGVHTDHDRLVGQVRPETVGVHSDGVVQAAALPLLPLLVTQAGLAVHDGVP